MAIKVEVIGMKAFKGTVQGEAIDSGTLFCRVKLDTRYNKDGENFKAGESIEEWKMPNAEAVFRMKHLPLPFHASLEVERVSNGKETRELVTECVPAEVAAPRGQQLKAA